MQQETENPQPSTSLVNTVKSLASTSQKKQTTITAEQMRAMCSVLNEYRLSKGWGVMTANDAEIMAKAWIKILNEHKIPYQHYDALYRRAIALVVRRLAQGLDGTELSAPMMAACWNGKHGLNAEVREPVISIDHQLEIGGEPNPCIRCLGTGRVLFTQIECDCGNGAT